MREIVPLLVIAAAVSSLAGCQRSPTDAASVTSTSPENGSRTIEVHASNAAGSPADLTRVQIAADAPPEKICEQFLSLLVAGEISDAERLLSKRSSIVTRQAGLVLSAPAGKAARYEFDPPQYANNKQKRAMVMCRVLEDETANSNQSMSWMLNHEESGWRIMGLVLLEDDQPADLLSFENPADVEQIRNLLGAEAPVREASTAGRLNR